MRKMITLVAILAVAACDSATGSDQAAQNRPAQPRAPEVAHFSGGAGHRAVIVSVRKRVAGTSPLYAARAVAVDGGEVTVEIRSSTTAFSSLTSGTQVISNTDTGEANEEFQATAGTRYLVIAYPSANGVVDATHASFIEALP